MGKYRKVDTRIWNDEKFMDLSRDGKLVFFFLLTHPSLTALGAMRHSIPGLSSEMRWLSKAFAKAFGEAFRKGLLEYDERACFLALPNFLKYNHPESPNVIKSWSDSLDLLPECPLKNKLIYRVKVFVEALPEAFREALPEAFRKSMPNQEQEQEQEQDLLKEPPLYGPPFLFGEFKNVSFKNGEYEKLAELLGSRREEYIDRLSAYLAQIGPREAGKKYKSHYATIRNWHSRDKVERKDRPL